MSEETFDLESAERLLPQLEKLLRAALDEKKRLTVFGRDQAQIIERIIMLGGSRIDPDRFSDAKKAKEESGVRLRELMEEIEELGCLVKDLDIGLVDFPCRLGGREFYLCWKLGEPRIQFWHSMDEGFAGRKPLNEKMFRQMPRSSEQ